MIPFFEVIIVQYNIYQQYKVYNIIVKYYPDDMLKWIGVVKTSFDVIIQPQVVLIEC